MIKKLKQHQDGFDLLISKVSSLKELKQLRSEFLGKKGLVSLMLNEMRSLPNDQKPEAGKHINTFKQNVATLIQEKIKLLERESEALSNNYRDLFPADERPNVKLPPPVVSS